MNIFNITIASLISFLVSAISVSIGGTSLVMVPLLVWLGMTLKNAIATNMFALIFLSLSGAIGFRKEVKLPDHKKTLLFLILTILGSFIGANIVLAIDQGVLKRIIAVVICLIAGFFLVKKDLGLRERIGKISGLKFFIGSFLIFILGIYGGFFSGGYVTLLSYVLVLILGLTFLQAAFATKIFNIFSSLAACVFFYYHNLIDFSVGIPLAVSMSLGAFAGAKLAIAKGNMWIRNLFIIVAILLALKLLFF